jgi:hypothetical protein
MTWQRMSAIARRMLRSQAGVGIVELLLAAFMTGLVSIAAFNFYKSQHSQFTQQTDVADMQQNLRAVMDELTRQIRQAGYGAYGQRAFQTLNNNTWLLIRYSDGTALRTKLFFPYYNTVTGQTDLYAQMDGEAAAVFAEGIDSVRFTPGGLGTGDNWITVDLMARTLHQGFQTVDVASRSTDKHLYRRLTSVVKMRNR